MQWQIVSILSVLLIVVHSGTINGRVLYAFPNKQNEEDKSNNTTSYNDVIGWEKGTKNKLQKTSSKMKLDEPLSFFKVVEDIESMDEMTLLRSLYTQMTSLRNNMANLKYQNHMMYKQLKKLNRINTRCSPSGAPNIGMHLRTGELPQSDARMACPPDFTWNHKTNKCYKFSSDRITWRMAREKCRNLGADLVTVASHKEQRFIVDTARNSRDLRHCDFWGGATDLNADKQWRWVGTKLSLSFRFWNHNEPNNGNGNEHCMQMLWVFGWMWNDSRCNYESSCYICETRR